MGAIARFLLALERLARRRGLKIEDAYKFAKQEFGEMTPLLKKQIENVFSKIKKPVVGKPGKKEGAVLPMVKEIAKKEEGIGSLDVSEFDEFNLSKDDPIGDLEKIVKGEGDTGLPKDPPKLDSKENIMGAIDRLKDPARPGGPLDPTIGITRTIARRILDRKGIEIGKKDPIDVFLNNFGIGAGTDIQNLGEEIAEAESSGRNLKPLDDLIDIEGFFDLEVQKNPETGLPTEDLIEQLEKDLEQKNVLEDFDPKGRKPSATGGRAQAASGGLAGILKL
jgi:hypothetical protein